MCIRKALGAFLLAATVFLSSHSYADQYVQLSTASQEVVFGPFVDDTDFKTAETAQQPSPLTELGST